MPSCHYSPGCFLHVHAIHVNFGWLNWCRAFQRLPSLARARLLDGLAMNMSYLCKSVTALLTSSSQPEDFDHMVSAHRSALKAYLFFLHWIASQARLNDQWHDAQAAASGIPPAVSSYLSLSMSHTPSGIPLFRYHTSSSSMKMADCQQDAQVNSAA